MTDPRPLFYLIGQPGAGKTTLLREVLAGLSGRQERQPFAHIVYDGGGVQLGAERAGFGGTDALALNVQPLVTTWLAQTAAPAIVAEGDRLANERFFQAARSLGWDLTVAWLATPDSIAEARRAARGSTQQAAWVNGRRTKVARLAQHWTPLEWILDGGLPVEMLAERIRQHPAIALLLGQGVGAL